MAKGKTRRNCDYCGKQYEADSRNLKRGWGLACSKLCAAKKSAKGQRSDMILKELPKTITEGRLAGLTSEGYRIIDGTAYNEFNEPMYATWMGDGDGRSWNAHKTR